MIDKLLVLILLPCPLWAAQSVLATPGGPVPSAPATVDASGGPRLASPALGVGNATRAVSTLPASSNGLAATLPGSSIATRSESEERAEPAIPSRIVAPLTTRSDFQVFAEDAAGRTLPVYGRELFDEVPSTFAPVDHIPVPADYALGPGDELLIRIWGKVDLDARATVDRNGQISLPRVGSLNVAGLRYAQLDSYLRAAVGNLYKDFELNVTLGQLRSIQIFVLGSARQPGAYTVSSLSTLVDALFASGGPSATGTMRRIQLRRADRVLTECDMYDLLRKGDKSHDLQLLPGDVIYIPPVGAQVAIVENVNEPGIYELKGETTISAALESAGGLTGLAGVDRVLLERIADHRMHRVDEFALDGRGLQRSLQDGDLVRIFQISPRFENAVTVRGNVARPGRFVWHEGMRISDLIPSREFLLTSNHWNQQNHLADKTDSEFMTDIAQINSEINWDYAAIERLDENDLSTRLIALNLGHAIDNPASSDNQALQAGDVLTVFSRRDLPLPLEKHSTFVKVGGEVNAPGVYRIRPGDTLRDLVRRAGGLTTHSYLYAAQLTRVSARQVQEEQLKLSIDRMQKELSSRAATSSRGASEMSMAPQAAGQIALDQQAQLGAQQRLISQLAGTRPTGRVVLGIRCDAGAIDDIPDFPLEDGDSFYIPPRLGTIQVVGEVYNENAFRYQAGKRLSSYLNDSGGATRTADLKRIFLIRADGTVVNRQERDQHWSGNFEKLVLMPGDAIVVPPKLKASGTFLSELPMITQVLSQTAMTGAVVSLIPQ